MTSFFEKHYRSCLVVILVFAIFTRFYRLSEPKVYMFDEVYHAVTSKLIAQNDLRAYEWWNPPPEPNTAVDWLHPPLAKYTQALGMLVFGENSFGWRVSSAFFGVLVIAMVYLLAEEAFGSKKLSILAAALTSLDGLVLVQSRIAMNDIHVTFAILLTLWCYLRFRRLRSEKAENAKYWLLATGVASGIALGSKWSGLFVLALVLGCEISEQLWLALSNLTENKKKLKLFSWKKDVSTRWRQMWSERARAVIFLILLPPMIYIFSYSHMFLQGKSLVCTGNQVEQGRCYCSNTSSWWVTALSSVHIEWQPQLMAMEARGGCTRLISHFSELHHQIWTYQTTLKATHPYQSRPYQWFWDLRPVWMYVEYKDANIANVYAFGNPLLFWSADVALFITLFSAVAAGCMWLTEVFKGLKKKIPELPGIHWSNLAVLLFAYGIVWAPWQLSPRIMFFYHYTPAVPLLCILFAHFLIGLTEDKSLKKWQGFLNGFTAMLLFGIFVVFCVWYPQWTNLAVPTTWANSLYFILPSWR